MIKKSIHFLLALALYGLLVFFIAYSYPGKENFDMTRLWPAGPEIFQSWLLTLYISIASLFFSMFTGFVLYLASVSKLPFFRYVGRIFDEIVFGSPLIVFIIAMYYFIAIPMGISNRLNVGILAFSLYMAPYMKSVLLGAMESIDANQYQAIQVLGFSKTQAYRYIIIPQILKVIFPPLIGNLTFIIKGSSLLSVIGVKELYFAIDRIQANLLLYVEGYLLMFITYLLMTIPLVALSRWIEKKVSA
jgi:polar amino acid transport system permease protein